MKGIPKQQSNLETGKKLKRIPTIDFLKGISLICVFYAHTTYAWFTTDFISFSRFQWYILDAFGPIMFVTLSMVGNMVGIEKRRLKGDEKLFPARNLIKVSYLLIWGEVINLNALNLGVFHLSAWNVITAIGIFTLALPVFLKMKPIYRLIIVGIIAITYYPLVQWTLGGLNDAGIKIAELMDPNYLLSNPRVLVYWFFFDHRMMCPIFSWLIIPLLTSVIFNGFIKAFARGASKQELSVELKKIGYYGLIIVAGALALGVRESKGFIDAEIGELLTPGFFLYPFEYIPQYWVDDCPEYIFYNLGVVCVLFSLLGTRQCIKGKENAVAKKFINAGMLSFTAFMVSHVAYIFPIKVVAPVFYVVFPAYLIVFILIFDFWKVELKSVASLEWLLGIYIITLLKLLKKPVSKRKEGVEIQPFKV